jgi:hypothetical protein
MLAAPEGLEPPTLGSEDQCSIQLSYGAAMDSLRVESLKYGTGLALAWTAEATVATHFSNERKWGGKRESNPQPPEPQSGALPVELFPPQELHYSNLRGRRRGLSSTSCRLGMRL